ncbi:MAG: hypothetical protein F7C35_05670 [Desulfurococcales archaeon]|nr:hypothetical protein [Desulfurococcales archaeon]
MPVRTRKQQAEAIALAAALFVVAIYLVFRGQGFTLRQLVALLIAGPSGVMLAYYIFDRTAEDRLYGIGLYTFTLIIGLIIYGINAVLLAGIFLAVVAVLVIISFMRPGSPEAGPSG